MLIIIKLIVPVTIMVAPLYGESLFIKSLKEQVSGISFFNTPKTPILKLDDVIKNNVDLILAKAELKEIILKPGRLSLLQEMSKEPRQLSKDLPRIPLIKIGKLAVPSLRRLGKTAERQFSIIAKLLTKYVATHQAAFVDHNRPGRLGPFDIEEILYGITQNFSALAVELAHEHPILKSGEWACVAQTAEQNATFVFENLPEPILVASFISTSNLVHVEKQRKKTKFITQSKLYFNLSDGEVSFFYSYSIDGTGSARLMPKTLIIFYLLFFAKILAENSIKFYWQKPGDLSEPKPLVSP